MVRPMAVTICQKAAVEAARAELARATTNLQDTELFAPQDGVVLTRVHEIGAVVQGGQTVYTVLKPTGALDWLEQLGSPERAEV